MARVSAMGSFAVATLAALALAAALATIISAITTGGESKTRRNCFRECHIGEHFTCHYDFEVHSYQTYSRNCKTCQNFSCPESPGCIEADGLTRLLTVVNEQIPGPAIQVCQGDTVNVKVKNYLVSSGVSIHWHGISMKGLKGGRGSPHMDGEPGVTQCLIMPQTEFTYRFVADPPGTHLWHAQSGLHRADGVFGTLVVRSPKEEDPNSNLYSEDLPEHTIMVNDWAHFPGEEKFFLHLLGEFSDYPKSILVNGKGPHQGNNIGSIPHTVQHQRFDVVKGNKYRFRFVSGAFLNCPISVSVEDHILTVIAADGAPVSPFNVSSIMIYPGERWDVVLNADQYPQPYWISFMGENDCVPDSVFQTAILDYLPEFHKKQDGKSRTELPSHSEPRFTTQKPRGKQLNGFNGICDFNNPCLGDLNSTDPLPESLKKEKADLILFFGFTTLRENHTFISGHYPRVLSALHLPPDARLEVPLINGFTFNPPPTPLIFQMNYHETCDNNSDLKYLNTKCVHIVKIPLGLVTDLVLVDDGSHKSGNVVHLHGYRFYVLTEDWGSIKGHQLDMNITYDLVDEIDPSKMRKRNLVNPIQKDTIAIPHKGFAVVRFLADNPGYWLLESQMLFDSQLGMKVVLQVGESHEIPKPPMNFPQCGNFN